MITAFELLQYKLDTDNVLRHKEVEPNPRVFAGFIPTADSSWS